VGGDDNDIAAGWEGADEIYGGDGDDLIAGDFGRDEQVRLGMVHFSPELRAETFGSQ
jgi:Ca2+-binding RTX toxin-like protein